MTSASEMLAAVAREALAGLAELNGAYDGMPVKASLPYAVIEIGPEGDWGWKGGEGREVRLAVTVRDAGERPGRLRPLMGEAEAALLGLGGAVEGWRIVNVVMVRVRTQQKRAGEWTGVVEVRVRMERVA
jgi:hypothetical protein